MKTIYITTAQLVQPKRNLSVWMRVGCRGDIMGLKF